MTAGTDTLTLGAFSAVDAVPDATTMVAALDEVRCSNSTEDQEMSYYAVIREAGPAWSEGKGAFEQAEANEHATYMNALADEGVVLFAGPLAGSEHGRIRVLLIMAAASETDIESRLARDPWVLAQRLATVSIEPWNVIVGPQRLSAPQLRAQ